MSERPSRGACAIAHLETFTAVRDLIEQRCGLHFDDSQRVSLTAAVAARMEHLGLNSDDEYYKRLRGEAPRLVETELRNLLNLVTVTETCFFRDAGQFLLLREHVIPALMAERSAVAPPNGAMRIWSAGCSTGDEAYSVAITLDDMGVFRRYPWLTVEIVGTDLNSEALEKARHAVYSERAVRNIEGRLLDRYFQRVGASFHLNDDIRERVRFEFGNITQSAMPSTGPQDVVFCKNVAIYFPSDVTRKVVRDLYDTISPGGYLFLGHSESLWQIADGFELVEHDRIFCYRKGSGFRVPVARSPERRAGFASQDPPSFDAAAQDVNPVSTRYDACLALFRASEWDAAESSLVALLQEDPAFVPAYLLLGGLYVHRARYDEAIAQAESVLSLTESEPRAHLLLGMIASRSGRSEAAVESLTRALDLDDSLALAHFWLGNLYRDAGDLARARSEYDNVVRGWERRTLQVTEEFAMDLSVEQLVEFCRVSLQRLITHG